MSRVFTINVKMNVKKKNIYTVWNVCIKRYKKNLCKKKKKKKRKLLIKIHTLFIYFFVIYRKLVKIEKNK